MLPRELQCAYRSKFCDAPRATKLDGTLHKLCDFHRRKANANQQRLHKRKKRILEQQDATPQTPKDGRAVKQLRRCPEATQSTAEPLDGGLTFQNSFDVLEVKILEVLLFGSECAAPFQSQTQMLIKDKDFCHPESPTTPSMMPVPVFDNAWSVTL